MDLLLIDSLIQEWWITYNGTHWIVKYRDSWIFNRGSSRRLTDYKQFFLAEVFILCFNSLHLNFRVLLLLCEGWILYWWRRNVCKKNWWCNYSSLFTFDIWEFDGWSSFCNISVLKSHNLDTHCMPYW